MNEKDFKQFMKDAEKQYKQIHPKWIYFYLVDLWNEYLKSKEVLTFVEGFNPALFRGRKGLRELKDILLDYQAELKKRV